ncbi:MAG: squalene synthase HpnC [Ignavibacteria bacterium 13_1_40CM_2_61_4]|nr:MAG: squalene synthase HpnC [Ignavibacteria bacterium 13_1_40CM_2_61_4]
MVRRHYENFPVVSRFLTPARRYSLAAIYAFARRADDIADAQAPPRERLDAIDQVEAALHRALDGSPNGPIFVALADSVERFGLPVEPLLDLLSAFRQDARDETFSTWDDLLAYCRGSANTIGRLVLALHGIEDADTLRESDAVCTALQLTNFWQDLGADLTRGRLFIPLEDLRRFGLLRENLARPAHRGLLTRLLIHECRATDELYDRGRSVVRRVPFGLALQLRMTIAGGRAVLHQVERNGWRVLRRRPRLGRAARARILIYSLLGLNG